MNVSSVSSAVPQAISGTSEAGEVRKAGPDHDGDADDRGAAPAAAAASRPSVNSLGQMIGQHLSVKA